MTCGPEVPFELRCGDCLTVMDEMESQSVQCVVTSPPYWGLRDYGEAGQLGLEPTPDEYVAKMVDIFRAVRRVLRDDGTVWLNLGDSYAAGKNLVGIPWRVAFALQADGWYLRQDIIWHKPNPMPESVTDRCTKAHEYIFLLSKSQKYYYDADAIKGDAKYPNDKRRPLGSEGAWQMDGRVRGENGGGVAYDHDTNRSNKRSVWTVTTQPYPESHFAVYPEALIMPCVKAGSAVGDTVLDPFCGSGTTGVVALQLERKFVGIELSEEYCKMASNRIGRTVNPSTHRDMDNVDGPLFAAV